ncbi:hypothetical protein M9Y10_029660 [Tritrichomonas musculus]|uniref:Mitochondrial import inner membrane translocase subunit TIM50 n=1 Tax=Tritrichomonas musculus TaxID=1915356 RepID=A0ABR2KMR2_9EUKA
MLEQHQNYQQKKGLKNGGSRSCYNSNKYYDNIKYKQFQINSFIQKNHKKKELTVILDLDNTLISSFILKPDSNMCDFLFSLQDGNQTSTIGVIKRPNVDTFLMALSKYATIYLFTAAKKEYVSEIIRQIDPIGTYFTKIFTREHCIQVGDKKFKKDYSICGTNMSRTLIVDDIPDNFKDYANNGISVKPFVGGINDDDLARVFKKIILLSCLEDVRTGISM